MNRHPNLAFLGGTVIIAIMVMAAFSNAANAGDYPRSKSAETTSVEAITRPMSKRKLSLI